MAYRRQLFLGLVLIAVGTLVVRADPPASTAPAPAPAPATESALNGQLTIPDTWRTLPIPRAKKAQVKMLLSPHGEFDAAKTAPLVNIVAQTRPKSSYKDEDLPAVAEAAAMSIVSSGYVDGTLVTFEKSTVAGSPAYRVVTTGVAKSSKRAQTSLQMMVIHQGKLYGFFYSCDPASYEKWLPNVVKMLESFRWKD